jgi:hypothetical protein
MKIQLRKYLAMSLTALAIPLLFTACTTAQSNVAISGIVGPQPPGTHSHSGAGWLIVNSERYDVFLDKEFPFHVHTSYNIETPDGHPVRWVANHIGDTDENAELVSLRAGKYLIVASSTDYGQVRVPILIEPGQTTTVHLEGKGSWTPAQPKANSNLVRFPDGEIVGWRAVAAN